MVKSDFEPTSGAAGEGLPPADPQLDAALDAFSGHFAHAVPSKGLTDTIMSQIPALRQAARGVLAPQLRDFLRLVAGSPRLQGRMAGTGTQSEFVSQVLGFAAEHGFALERGQVYALLQRYTAANDGELSDEALDGVAAAGASVPFQFESPSGLWPGDSAGHGVFSWSFGFKPRNP